ncbi:MAG TPA: SAM-dependent methyltransferase [Hansschlegelia sp.]
MRHEGSLPSDYFERMFEDSADPWAFETSDYERAKYDATIAALNGRRYEAALEVGCANGVMTERLAGCCDALVAVDVSETALQRARARLKSKAHITFERRSLPNERPEGGPFDLILLSEVAYYWDRGDLSKAADYLASASREGADLLLVHWTGETDYPLTGDEAAEGLIERLSGVFRIERQRAEPEYRLDLLRRG